MKKIFSYILPVFAALSFASCSDLSSLENRVDSLESRVEALENGVKKSMKELKPFRNSSRAELSAMLSKKTAFTQ